MRHLFATNSGTHGLVLRLAVGLLIFPHGAQKLFGWFGGHGWEGTMGFFTSLGIPAPVAALVIVAESIGALLLVTGLLTRVWAAVLGATMIGAMATLHWGNGFFMNWNGDQAGEGIEYNLVLLAITGLLTVYGGGRWSADQAIAEKLAQGQSERFVDRDDRLTA